MTAAAALILLAASAQLSTGHLLFGVQSSQLPQRQSQLPQLPPFRPQQQQLQESRLSLPAPLQLVSDSSDWSESPRQLGGLESNLGPDPAEYVAETEGLVPVSVAIAGSKRKRGPAGRSGPSLSIVNPLQVLRQRLMLEIVRRRMRQKQTQITANSEILQELGKRSVRRMEKRQNQEYLETSRANLDR